VDGLASALPRAEVGVLRKALALIVVALAVGGAGGWLLFDRLEDEDVSQATEADWSTCTNDIQGFSIDYPAAWHTDHPAPELACFLFDPRRFEVPRDSDFTGTALEVILERPPDESLAEGQIRERTRVKVGDHDAIRFEAHREDGMVVYGYAIEAGGTGFSIVTTGNEGVDYTAWRRIVDKAAGTLRTSQRGFQVVEGSNVAPPQLGLPPPVARKRAQIWKAAKSGDYEDVAQLVDPKGFEYTFGGAVPGGPAAYWRRVDQTTKERPIETLTAILELPYVHQQEHKLYVWPFAFTRKASTLSSEEREQLVEAIGEEIVKFYEQLDNYLGYRAGIDSKGNWVFYVAGD
jgi:hypothetical protein